MALPNNQIDGFIVFDASGSRYQYVADVHGWINIGAGINTQIVDYTKAGLLAPSMIGLLEDARSIGNGFKIYQNQNVYYYMLLPQNRLFRFSSENNCVLVELDRAVLTNLIQYSACPGDGGTQGIGGDAGADGVAGPVEKLISVAINGTILSFDAPVDVALSTPISIRLLYDGAQLVEIWYDAALGQHQIISNDSGYVLESIDIGYSGGILVVSIKSSDSWGIGWSAKARQRGPVGFDGLDGNSFIVVSSITADLTSRGGLIGIRSVGDDLRTMNRSMDPDSFPAAHLRPYQSTQCSDIVSITLSDKYAAVAPSLDYSKPIWRWVLDMPGHEFGVLDTPAWVPDPSCGSGVQFSWWDGLPVGQPGIVEAEPIPEKCCQEDFFFCPNIGTCSIGSNAINLAESGSSSRVSSGSSSGQGGGQQ